MTPKNNVKLDDHEGMLLCPDCGEINLHQGQVEAWNRPEDADTGNHIVVVGDSVTGDNDMSKNPSPRRQGLSIEFACEHCSYDEKTNNLDGKVFTLNIIQHKGSTYLMWKEDDDSDG